MPSFKFTEKAEADLASIVDFTAEQWGSQKANQYIDALVEMCQTLADNPDIGLNRDIMLNGLLCFPYECHMLYYFKQPHGITIIRVIHKNMDSEQHI